MDFYQRDCEDMAALMKEIGATPFSIGGFSDGGNVALLLGSRYTDLVTKIFVWGANSFVSKQDIEAHEESHDTEKWPDWLKGDDGHLLQGMWDEWRSTERKIYKAGGNIARNELSQITCPTLILHGQRDSMTPFFHAEVIKQKISHARFDESFSDGGHFIHLKQRDDFNKVVLNFLRGERHDSGR